METIMYKFVIQKMTKIFCNTYQNVSIKNKTIVTKL